MVTIIVAVLIFLLGCWLISIVPLPSTAPPAIRTILYIIWIICGVVYLLRYI